jgi:hypothetical protein
MEGLPEGTPPVSRRRFTRGRLPPLRWILGGAFVAAYLIFRLVQAGMWLAGHL